MQRRLWLCAAAMAALPLMHPTAMAQAWPARPIKLVVPFAAGISPDVVARLIADKLGTALGQALHDAQPVLAQRGLSGSGGGRLAGIAHAAEDAGQQVQRIGR